jgi:CTP synthase (UTP-ammonia lyase)
MDNNALISINAKTIEVKSPKYTKINKNINIICSPDKIINKYNNKKLSLYENIIFDNINELEAESKFLTQTSNILNDNITKKNSILNFKIEENNKKNKKNKIEVSSFRSRTNLKTPCVSNKRSKKDISESLNNSIKESSINCVRSKNRPYYPIRIKRRTSTQNKLQALIRRKKL